MRTLILALLATAALAQKTNDPAAVELFRDRGFACSYTGPSTRRLGELLHSLAGASRDYVNRFFSVLPGQFNPDRFEPEKWASLAKLAGFEYVVFTTKHHAGFCMWNTETTPFSVGPYALRQRSHTAACGCIS